MMITCEGIIWSYAIIINLIGWLTVRSDKKRAIRGKWRIPEQRLWLLAIAGGACGVYWAMRQCRHKTQKTAFRYFMPLLLGLYIVAVIYTYSKS
ncbi:DUF1294 domain-containing protein [Tuberibacillus sp. Marseille-P3662]|uniref:DUF1294 domain-containing protein n=1 Tax=Tuberibacillus sp. Marseille-P3662 TaxID=1965358 RepID=UPI0020CAB55B|nr:DUF1294 domain-containing protein [Tuberibacillus sp. Marseille-P3662]